jgi:hypothetical protein
MKDRGPFSKLSSEIAVMTRAEASRSKRVNNVYLACESFTARALKIVRMALWPMHALRKLVVLALAAPLSHPSALERRFTFSRRTPRMRIRAAVPLALGLLAAHPAFAAVDPGRVTVRGSSGFTSLSLRQINEDIKFVREAFQADTLVDESRWEPFGGAPSFRVEIDAQLTKVFSAAIGFSMQSGHVRHEAFRVLSIDPDTGEDAEIESFDRDERFQAWDLVGTLGLWVPSAPGLNFGLQAGYVRGTYRTERAHLIDTFTQLPSMEIGNGVWRGSGVVLGAFTGYERPVTQDLSIATRVGYRYRRVGRLDGTFIETIWGDQGNERSWESGPLLDLNGRAMPLDLSGTYFDIGLTLGFGGGTE